MIEKIAVGKFQIEFERCGSGVPVLLESGALGNITDWDDVFYGLSEYADVIRYSRVGHGNSTTTNKQFTAQEFAIMASDFLNAIDVEGHVVVVGHSYGGKIAKYFAAKHVNRVLGLLLLDPAHHCDMQIVLEIDRREAKRQIAVLKKKDYLTRSHWSGLDDAWDKTPHPDGSVIGDIPVTLIASIQRFNNPKNLLETEAGRLGWAKYQSQWVATFRQGKIVLEDNIDHMMIRSSPEFVINQFKEFLLRIEGRH